MSDPITVWGFHDAPENLRNLSTNGGDEDWLVEMPQHYYDCGIPYWMERMDSCREPKIYQHPSKPGWMVIIASHA